MTEKTTTEVRFQTQNRSSDSWLDRHRSGNPESASVSAEA